MPGLQHDVSLDDMPAVAVRSSDNSAFENSRMLEQHVLHFRTRNVVTTRNDHVVGAGLIPEVSVEIHLVRVTGQIPSVLYVLFLLFEIVEVPASRWSANCEPAYRSRRNLVPSLIHDARLVTGNDLARRARTNVVSRGTDEDVQHLGRTDSIDDPEAGCFVPGVKHCSRQRFSRGNAFPQAADVMTGEHSEHCTIRGWRSETDCRAVFLDCLYQVRRRCLLQQKRRSAIPHRKEHQSPERIRESERRRPAEEIILDRLKNVPRKGVRDGHDVTVGMHSSLSFTRRPRRERDYRDVLGGSVMVDELRRLVAHHRLETEVRIAVEVDDTSTIAWRAV